MSDDLFPQYAAAMKRWGGYPCVMQLDVVVTCQMLSTIMLALRHPHFPPHQAEVMRELVNDSIAQLDRLDPIFGIVLRRGDDPAFDGPPGDVWCEACRSFHPEPRDEMHHRALNCNAPWTGGQNG